MRLVAAPDKLAGTLSAAGAAAAIAGAAERCGFAVDRIPLSDGGEGFSSLVGGELVAVDVHGPLGELVSASLSFVADGCTAVIEMASAAGRSLLPDPRGDDCLRASTAGVGELMVEARSRGARRIVVGCGGSATTDGGLGMLEAVDAAGGLGAVEIVAATDVTTRYRDAARLFAPQKGASPAQVEELSRRLDLLAEEIDERAGTPASEAEGSGAAGGLGGALIALGARRRSGFDILAEIVGLDDRLRRADVVVTAEGRVDAGTLEGKVVSGVIGRAPLGARVVVIAGSVDDHGATGLEAMRPEAIEIASMADWAGLDRAMREPEAVIEEIVADLLG